MTDETLKTLESNPNHTSPLPGPAVPAAEPAAQRESGASEQGTIAQYFSDNGSGMMQAHQRWRSATFCTRLMTVAFGVGLIAYPVIVAWITNGGAATGLVESITSRPDLLILGIPLVLVGVAPWLWRFGWELPAGLLLLIFAGEMLLYQPTRPIMTSLLSLFAIGAIGYGIYLRWKRRRVPGTLKDIEQHVDQATDKVLRRAIDKALKNAPFPADYAPDSWQILRTIPERSRLPSGKLQQFVGHDKRPRITPLGFAAFNCRDRAVAVVQGAVDLTKEHVLFNTAQELSYSEIQAMHWSQEAPAAGTKQSNDNDGPNITRTEQPPASQNAPLQFAGIKPFRNATRTRQFESLTMDLSGNRQIVLVFHDSNVLNAKAGRNSIESIGNIRAVWTAISNRRLNNGHATQKS